MREAIAIEPQTVVFAVGGPPEAVFMPVRMGGALHASAARPDTN